MIERGLYQLNYRGLSLAEAWRFSNGKPLTFLFALGFKAMARKGAKLWLPAWECETDHPETGLSETARARLVPVVNEARSLGYADGRFATMTRKDDPAAKEAFSYVALHADGVRTLFVAFIAYQAESQPAVERTTVAGTVNLTDGTSTAFSSETIYLDGMADVKHVRIKGDSVATVDAAMAAFVAKEGFKTRRFGSWQEMKRHANEANDRAFEARIRRGLYVRVEE